MQPPVRDGGDAHGGPNPTLEGQNFRFYPANRLEEPWVGPKLTCIEFSHPQLYVSNLKITVFYRRV